ncbi:uncharacterized protein LOC133479977 [Phyllopteryx taeniolatus]|uniref:uncharacterized protein LOC133479977 n=1 Tax=Phyllopteryx taeniolatus TaxID=161469 RepID=UPI002AD2F356|nr:uncharacterized protein LOC133479977 [Phyllopteryx taeniolatus]
MLQRRVNQDSPTTSRAFSLNPRDRRARLRDPRLCFLMGRRVGGMEEVFEVFTPPTHNIPSRGQQCPIPTIHSVDGALVPPPEMPDGGPEFPQSHSGVVLHGLTKLLPRPSFCLSNHQSCIPLGQPLPISCLRSPTGQKGPIGLLLQLDGIPHCWCPPTGSGITATTGTDYLTATAPEGRLSNGGAQHGPLSLLSGPVNMVPRLPRDVGEVLPSDGILPDAPSRPSQYVWACQVGLASSPTIGANSPRGGDHLTVPPFSSPECPRYAAASPMTRPQSRSSNCDLGCPGPESTCGHPYA